MSYLNYGNRELLKKARELRNSMTKAEILLWSKIRSKKILGLKFRRQQPVFDYVVDFYCDSLKLIIEVDGYIHSLPESNKYDRIRENILKDHGFRMIRFTNDEVEFEIDLVMKKLYSYLLKTYPELSPDNNVS